MSNRDPFDRAERGFLAAFGIYAVVVLLFYLALTVAVILGVIWLAGEVL
jgi:hypothetical protein